ncbi:MAG: HAMP domain-containing methyl-accepting chemotaxis protein [Pseudomonadota bacterium]
MKLETIGSKVLAAGLFSLVLSGTAAGTGLWVSFQYSNGVAQAVSSASVMRDVMTGDMMHDTLRADAMNAVLSANPESRLFAPSQVAADVQEHVENFKSAINSAKQTTHSIEVRNTLNALETPLTEYYAAAQNIAAAAATGEAQTRALIPAFQEKFDNLEEAMGTAGDVVENATKADAKAAADQAKMSQMLMAVILLLGVGFAVSILMLARKQIVAPLNDLTDSMDSLARGDLNVEAHHANMGGEIGRLAASLLKFKETAIEAKKLQEREAMSTEERIARGRKIEEITNNFAAFLEEGLTTLSSTSQELQANACQMGAMASQTENLTQEATRASSNASEGVNSIASATTQLTANVEQIAQQMQRSAIIANEASQTSRDTGEAVKALATAVTEISEVVSLIDEVAAQTNLLALNATIEAARAGEAGRGFAVVASEVKGLAAQTATATQDIEHRIGRIKEASSHVAQSVSRVIEMVEEMQELANASSNAVHEQSGATALIAESASVASQGTSEANEHVVILSNSAQDAAEASRALSQAAEEVANRAAQLRTHADEFFHDVKAA